MKKNFFLRIKLQFIQRFIIARNFFDEISGTRLELTDWKFIKGQLTRQYQKNLLTVNFPTLATAKRLRQSVRAKLAALNWADPLDWFLNRKKLFRAKIKTKRRLDVMKLGKTISNCLHMRHTNANIIFSFPKYYDIVFMGCLILFYRLPPKNAPRRPRPPATAPWASPPPNCPA